MESSFLTRDQALSLWSGSTFSKTPDYQRTIPREYQIVRNHTKETTEYKIQQQLTTSSTLCRTSHLNKKQTNIKYKLNHQQTALSPHSALHIRGKTNKHKLSLNLTLYEAYTNHWTNLRRAETKRRKESNLETWEKETSNPIN